MLECKNIIRTRDHNLALLRFSLSFFSLSVLGGIGEENREEEVCL